MFHGIRWLSAATLTAVILLGPTGLSGTLRAADGITVRGNFVSDSVPVHCPLPPQIASAAAVLESAAEGTQVRKGDVLLRFDSTPLEAERIEQQLAVRTADAELVAAECQLESAQLALEEYLQATYVEQKESIDSAVWLAEEALNLAKRSLDTARKRAAVAKAPEGEKGPEEELTEKGLAVRRAEGQVRFAKLKRDLLERYAKPRMTRQLQSAVRTAQAARGLAEAKRAAAETRVRDLSRAIERCVVRAPAEGRVAYPREVPRRTGDAPRAGGRPWPQPALAYLIRGLHFQATLSQADTARVREGMAARMQIDAFPDRQLTGRVQKTRPASGADVGGMTVLIELVDPPDALRSGMTGQATLAPLRAEGARDAAKR